MKRANSLNQFKLWAAILAVSVTLVSCDKDDPEPGGSGSGEVTFSVLSFIGDFAYLNATGNVESGTISVLGEGLELNTYGVSAQYGEHYYIWNSAENTIVQYKAEDSTFTEVTSIAVTPLLPDERPRVMRTTDEGDLIINSWPDSEGNVYYAVIALPDFTVSTKGNIKPAAIRNLVPGQTELVVAGGKAYLGTSYFDAEYTTYPDSIVTWVYDYPSFDNGKMLVSDVAAGNAGGYVGPTNIFDEKGDVYQAPINSSHWYYSGNDDAYILKLSDGEYDDSYNFNLSAALGKTIGLWSIFYAEEGIAYAKVVENDAELGWGPLRNTNTVTLVKIDLYNKTATEINLPKFYGFFLQNGVAHDGKFYLPVSILDGETNVYIFDIDGGADAFTKGAKLEGENVLAASMFVH